MSEPHLHDHRDDDPHHECAHEIATLRAEVERWVKEVARLKLSAEKAERDAGNKFGFK